eukprot:14025789-Alexandrium_andersonii.AAC.1
MASKAELLPVTLQCVLGKEDALCIDVVASEPMKAVKDFVERSLQYPISIFRSADQAEFTDMNMTVQEAVSGSPHSTLFFIVRRPCDGDPYGTGPEPSIDTTS